MGFYALWSTTNYATLCTWTGSFVMGALSMFAFSIGTVPLMLGFGYISSRLSKSLSNNIFKYSGVFIIILGLSMGQRGLALTGINIPI